MKLSVDDGNDLGVDLGGDGDDTLDRVLALVGSLDGVDDGHDLLSVGQEAGAGRENVLDIEDLDGARVLEVVTLRQDLRVLAEVLGDALEGLHDVVLVDGVETFVAGETRLDEDFSRLLLALLNLQLLGDLLEVLLDSLADVALLGDGVHGAVQKVVHTLGVDAVGHSLENEGRVVDLPVHVDLDGDSSLLAVDPGVLVADSSPQVIDVLTEVVVVGVLGSVLVGLDHVDDALGLEADSLQLRDLSVDQALEGAVDEGGNLLGGLEPGAGGDLHELGRGRLSPGKDGDGGNADLGVLGRVVDDGQEDGLDQDGVLLGDALQRVDGDGADHRPGADLSLDDLDQGLETLDVSKLSERGDGNKADVVVLLGPAGGGLRLDLVLKVGDPFLGDDAGLVGAEVAVDADGELGHPANGVDASAVEQLAHLDHADGLQIPEGGSEGLVLVPFQVLQVLDELDELLEEFLGRGPDGAEDSLKNVDGRAALEISALDVLLDEHGGGVGADNAENVVEEALQDLLGSIRVPSGLQDLLLDSLELLQAEGQEVLGDGGQVSGGISSGAAALGAFEDLGGDPLELVDDLAADLVLGDADGEQHLGGGVEVGLGEEGDDARLVGLLVELSLGLVLVGLGELEDEALLLLQVGGGRDGREGSLLPEKFDGDGGGPLHVLLGVESQGVEGEDVLLQALADGELVEVAADDAGGGDQVLKELKSLLVIGGLHSTEVAFLFLNQQPRFDSQYSPKNYLEFFDMSLGFIDSAAKSEVDRGLKVSHNPN